MILHENGKWVLKSKDGSKTLGTHATKEEAEAQERAVEAAKHTRGDSTRVFRADRGELAKPERLPNGWLRADGFIARAGVLEYSRADGSVWREYRPPEEAFNQDTLDSFALVPLTNNHPPSGLLTADNTREYQVGTIQAPHKDGDKVRTRMMITDPATISDAESGKVELSCGYSADVEMTPGTAPDGQHYDAIQRNVRGNHVALVAQARAGHAFRIRMDSAEGTMLPSPHQADSKGIVPEKDMKKIRIDGVDYEVSEQAAQAFEKAQKASAEIVEKYSADLKAARAEGDAAKGRADALEGELKKAKAELTEAPKKIREQVQARAALEAKASEVLGEDKFDGKSDLEIKRAVVESVLELKLDGKPEAYVEASYDVALKTFAEQGSRSAPFTAPIEHEDGEDSEALIEQMRKRSREAYKAKA